MGSIPNIEYRPRAGNGSYVIFWGQLWPIPIPIAAQLILRQWSGGILPSAKILFCVKTMDRSISASFNQATVLIAGGRQSRLKKLDCIKESATPGGGQRQKMHAVGLFPACAHTQPTQVDNCCQLQFSWWAQEARLASWVVNHLPPHMRSDRCTAIINMLCIWVKILCLEFYFLYPPELFLILCTVNFLAQPCMQGIE